MSQLWQMTKTLFMWSMGESDDDVQCKCDWTEEEDAQLEESSGIGTVLVIYMILVGFFVGAYLIPSRLTSSTARQQLQLQQQQQQQQHRRISKAKTLSLPLGNVNGNGNTDNENPNDTWHDVLLPQGEEVSWLIHAQQNNLLQLNSDRQQLRQLQQLLMLTLSMRDEFHDLPSDDSDEDQFKDLPESSETNLNLAAAVNAENVL